MVLTNTELNNILTTVKTTIVSEFVEFATGSGTATELPTNTSLQAELLQQARQDYSNLSDRVVLSGFVGAGQLNGDTMNELGWKDAASGNLLQRKVVTAFAKTSAKEYWSDLTITPSVTQP